MRINEKAAQSLKSELNKHGKDAVRLELGGYGCGGPDFNIVLDEQKQNDTVFEKHGIKFVVNKEQEYLTRELEIIDIPNRFTTGTDKATKNGR